MEGKDGNKLSMDSGKRRIIVDGPSVIPEEDRKYINELNLSSADLFKIFGIVAKSVLGIKVIGYSFDPEKVQTTVYLE